MKEKVLISIFIFLSGFVQGQDLLNFYLESNVDNNSVTLNTTVYYHSLTTFQTVTTQTNGNIIEVAICYSNSAVAERTFDNQENKILLPGDYTSYIINLNLFGDDDGLPCENDNLVDLGSINFDYPLVQNETTFIQDDNFEFYLENTFSGDGELNNNLVFTHRIKNIGKLILNDQLINVDPIESLIGIEDIPRLKYLYCEQNLISTLDVSSNLNLIELTCGFNLLNELDLTNNIVLKKLWCGFDNLNTLDVSNNTLLENLFFAGDGFTEIDLSLNTNLKHLGFNGKNIIGIDLSQNINLTVLNIGLSQFNDLDLSNNLLLEELSLSNTSVLSLNLINNTQLLNFNCEDGELNSLDIMGLNNLKTVFCNNNHLTNINLSTNFALEKVQLIENNLTSLNLKNGNNANINTLVTIGNSDLYCIEVDDETQAPYPGWIVDSQTEFSEDCSLGIEGTMKSEISTYPNPLRNILFIENKKNETINSIQILDILGKIVFSEKKNLNKLQVSHLKSGVYFIKITTENGLLTKKMIKK